MTSPSDHRPAWDQTWLAVAEVIGRRSRCVNSRVGAVVVSRDNQYHVVGYNGPPRGLMLPGECSNWCPRAKGEGKGGSDYSACESIHAEVNALLRADATAIAGGTMYVSRAPCINCARVIANSGVGRVVAHEGGEDPPDRAREVFSFLENCRVRAGYYRRKEDR